MKNHVFWWGIGVVNGVVGFFKWRSNFPYWCQIFKVKNFHINLHGAVIQAALFMYKAGENSNKKC